MPVQRRSWFFQHFEKIVCGAAAALVLLGVYFVRPRRTLPPDLRPNGLNPVIDRLAERARTGPPPVADPPSVGRQVTARYTGAPGVGSLPNKMALTQPEVYEPVRVGPGMQFRLTFRAPLAADTVRVTGEDTPLDIVTRPGQQGVDYNTVVVQSRQVEGEATVEGAAGGVKHIYPVVVSADVAGAPPKPGGLVVQEARGSVLLECTPPAGAGAANIAAYEIWRRDASDPLSEFERVGTATVEEAGTEDYSTVVQGLEGLPEDQKQELIQELAGGNALWRDLDVSPGNRYIYTARAVGRNTCPEKGGFAESVIVHVVPNTDFRFTLVGADSVRFELLKKVDEDRFIRKSRWLMAGDKIATVEVSPETGGAETIETNYTVVDLHRRARVPGTQRTASRVIYADEAGLLHARYWGEVGSEELWEEARTAGEAAGGGR